jgi:methyl-accepting chemotaxis protein
MTIKMRFIIILVTLIVGFALFGLATFTAMKKLNVNGEIYQHIVRDKDLVADVLPPPEYIIESYLVALQLMQSQDTNEIEALIQSFDKLKADYDTRHDYWKAREQELTPELKTPLLDISYQAALAFYLEAKQQFIPAILKGNNEIATVSLTKMRESYQKHRLAIDEVVSLSTTLSIADEALAQNIINQYHLGLSSIFIFSVGIACFLTLVISRNIIRQLGAELFEVVELSKQIAQGNYDSITLKIDNSNSLMNHMNVMARQILERRTVATNLKNEILRIKLALDNVNTGVMISDNELNIVYVNKSAVKTLNENEAGIRKQLPSFDSNNLIGRNIDSFHKNPTIQRKMLGALTEKYKTNIVLGEHNMVVLANPVINDEGQRLGTVAEWHDRTAEIEVENAVTNIVASASIGDFSNAENHG